MAEKPNRTLPVVIVVTMTVVITAWFVGLVVLTPPPPSAETVQRLSAEATNTVRVAHTISPRIPLKNNKNRWLVGRGTVVAGFEPGAALPYKDKGGTIAFKLPSARLLSVDAEVMYMEDSQGRAVDLPDDITALESELEVALRSEAVVRGLLREADAQLLRHLKGRFAPMGFFVEAIPGS